MEKLVIKWKHWYWYCLLAFNVFIPAFLSLNRVLSAKNILTTNSSPALYFLAISAPALATLFLVYVFKAMKEANACKLIIKPSRLKYFQFGLISSFLSFNLYVISLLVYYKSADETLSSIIIYISIAVCCVFGTISSAFLTMYEFCVNFDIFYNKNKETIIKQYLENSKNKIKNNQVKSEK